MAHVSMRPKISKYATKMTIAPEKPKTEPITIPDTLPPLDDPFWKPY